MKKTMNTGNLPQVNEAMVKASNVLNEVVNTQSVPSTIGEEEKKRMNRRAEIEVKRINAQRRFHNSLLAQEKSGGLVSYCEKMADKFWIDPEKDYPEADFLLSFNGKGFLPLGDIVLFAGRPKSGKTSAMMVLAASVLGCKDFGLAKGPGNSDTAKVLWYDTEQSLYNASRVGRIVCKMAGLPKNSKRFRANSLRGASLKEMVNSIISGVNKYVPDLVVIDGVADLIENFNDVSESSNIVKKLLEITSNYNCTVVTLLHTNKENDNPKGHLGSLLMQKASDVLYVNKSKGIFSIKESISRNGEFEGKIGFAIDENGMIQPAAAIQISVSKDDKKVDAKTSKREKERKLFVAAFGNKKEMGYSELVAAYLGASAGAVGAESTAKKHISEATIGAKNNKYSLLQNMKDEKGKSVYSLLPEGNSESENGGENAAENGGEKKEPLKFDFTVN